MALNIKDPATERSIRELAAATGDGLTTAVRKAVEERLQRVRAVGKGRSLADELLAIGNHCAALPDLDLRSADDILGYDDHGLPR
jgi:antitoxin VapB